MMGGSKAKQNEKLLSSFPEKILYHYWVGILFSETMFEFLILFYHNINLFRAKFRSLNLCNFPVVSIVLIYKEPLVWNP